MAGNRIEIMKLKNVIELKNKGLSNRRIAQELGVGRNTVNSYVTQFKSHNVDLKELSGFSEDELHDMFFLGSEVDKRRFEELAQYFEYFGKELKKVGCTKETLWRHYRAKHPDGYLISQFNHHLNTYLNQVNGSTKLTHKYGDKLYIDFTGKKLSYINRVTGEVIEVEVFVGVLPASQYTFVCAVKSQSLDDLVSALNACLQYFKGVPLAIVPDNLKAAVIKSHKFEPKINPTLRDFARHYGCVINPTRVYSPQDKALVENAVSIAYKRIFYPLNKMTCFSLEDLNAEIQPLLQKYNDHVFSKRNTTRHQEFLTLEKAHLIPLPSTPYEIRHFKQLTVQKMGHVYLSVDKHYYSVPYRFIGSRVSVMYNTSTVEVFHSRERIALHTRSGITGGYSTHKEHLSSSAKAYSEWSLEYFQDWAKKVGIATHQYVTELIESKPYPEIGYKQALGILSLKKQYEVERIETACKRALETPRRSYHFIETILINGMDKEDYQPENSLHKIHHSNIRGADNFK